MSDVEDKAMAPAAAKKGRKAAEVKVPAKPTTGKTASHPPVGTMVIEAVTKLNEKGGSSLQAIKKYILDNHKAEMAAYIRKFIKGAVEKGTLVQTKGKGASGSFKLPTKPKPEKPLKAKVPKKVPVKEAKTAKQPAAPPSPKAKAPVKKAAPKKALSTPESPKAKSSAGVVSAPIPAPIRKAPAPRKTAAPKSPVKSPVKSASPVSKANPKAKKPAAKPKVAAKPKKTVAKVKLPKMLPSKA